eukprot:COSAG03_NODE_2273_length_2928_cov_5.970308_1_plen_52_part_10
METNCSTRQSWALLYDVARARDACALAALGGAIRPPPPPPPGGVGRGARPPP